VENESVGKIKCLRSDGGMVYFSSQFNGYLQHMGIRREFSCRYTPEKMASPSGRTGQSWKRHEQCSRRRACRSPTGPKP
jgi:hypothetical protein